MSEILDERVIHGDHNCDQMEKNTVLAKIHQRNLFQIMITHRWPVTRVGKVDATSQNWKYPDLMDLTILRVFHRNLLFIDNIVIYLSTKQIFCGKEVFLLAGILDTSAPEDLRLI